MQYRIIIYKGLQSSGYVIMTTEQCVLDEQAEWPSQMSPHSVTDNQWTRIFTAKGVNIAVSVMAELYINIITDRVDFVTSSQSSGQENIATVLGYFPLHEDIWSQFTTYYDVTSWHIDRTPYTVQAL